MSDPGSRGGAAERGSGAAAGGASRPSSAGSSPAFSVTALDGIPEIRPDDDLAALVAAAYAAHGPADGDILVVTSKVVSKAEGRVVRAESRDAAIDAETVRVVATVEHAGGRTRIVENPQGLVLAAAGVDASNAAEGEVLLLPADPDASARTLAAAVRSATGARVGVVLSDTLGRAWRAGQIDQAIGAAGVRVVDDLRGTTDVQGRVLEATIAAIGDELASAAELVKGKTSGRPVAVIRGLGHLVTDALDEAPGARALQRPGREDLFRVGAAEAWREGYEAALARVTELVRTRGGLPAERDGSSEAGSEPASGAEPRAVGARRGWTVVVPVKPAAVGKSRLDLAGADRVALARAIALDTVAAAAASIAVGQVLVVTSDDETSEAVAAIAAIAPGTAVSLVPDTAGGLLPAIALGIAAADPRAPRAVLLGDLPGLRAEELEHALRLAGTAGRTFVPDAEGSGSVLATARGGLPLEPRFGPDSARAHRAAGFTELHLPVAWGLRRDADTAEQLLALRAEGALGPRTAAELV